MEYALGGNENRQKSTTRLVLILVLMEYALGVQYNITHLHYDSSLNPCFNGICSRRIPIIIDESNDKVLILVLMEYALGEQVCSAKDVRIRSLNPCFNGICSRRYRKRADKCY